jgi:hypothetical protein
MLIELKMLKKSFKIDNSIYNLDAINSSIDDFKDSFSIFYKDWVLEIEWDDDREIENIFWEFMNYVVWKQNEE